MRRRTIRLLATGLLATAGFFAVASSPFLLGGCDGDTAEEAGENVDEAIDDAADAIDDAVDDVDGR